MRETDRKIGRLEGIFHNQWGRLVEALVEPRALALFQARGLAVEQSIRRLRSRKGGRNLEFDVVLVDGVDLVVIEVKSTFRVEDVRDFTENELPYFKEGFPQYAGMRVLGAVAALEYAEESDRFAARQGLFVLRSEGTELEVLNPLNFQPRAF